MNFTEEQVGPIWDRTEGCVLAWSQMEEGVKKDILSTVNTTVEQALEAAKGTPIEPENVLEGDVVRGVELSGPGGNAIIEGVARKDESAWGRIRIGGYAIGVLDDLRLTSRPKPKLPTEPGARIKVTKLDDENGEWLAKLSENGSWNVFDLIGDDGMYWVRPFRIQEWNFIEILEVNK
jgi:hypothetical protein